MIRQFQPEDAQTCYRLIHACLEGDSEISPALREKLRNIESDRSMQERARLFYLAVYETEDGIVGIVGLDMNEVRLLYVSPDHQRRKIGRALLEHVESMVPPALFADIFVYSSLAATGFYRAHGFVEGGRSDFEVYGEPLHTTFMSKPTSTTKALGMNH